MCPRLQDVYHSKLPLHSSSSLFLHSETYSQNLRNMNCSIKTHVSVHLASLLEVEYRIHVSGNFRNDLMFIFFTITFTLQNIQKYAEIISGIVYYQNFFKLQKMSYANKKVTHFAYLRKFCDTYTRNPVAVQFIYHYILYRQEKHTEVYFRFLYCLFFCLKDSVRDSDEHI